MVTPRTPYAAIEPPVRPLIRVLNRFRGVSTYTSCGGHPDVLLDQEGCRSPEGYWYVDSHIERSDGGWAAMEFFAWLQYDQLLPPGVVFEPLAKAPYLNRPGSMLFFRFAGGDPDEPAATPGVVAERITYFRLQYFIAPRQARRIFERWPEQWQGNSFAYSGPT